MFVCFGIVIDIIGIIIKNLCKILQHSSDEDCSSYGSLLKSTSGSMSSFMMIIEEVGSLVAATVVVMVVIDIDGRVSSSWCNPPSSADISHAINV
jgi:hypothetical protein